MRAEATAERTLALLPELGRATSGARLYLTGGASAVLIGWRERTVDVDIRLDGDEDRLLRAISALKDRLDINIELAGPLDFLPEPEGWRERSPSVGRFGRLEVFHTDFALQALSKIERGFPQDLDDVRAMLDRGLTDAHAIRRTFRPSARGFSASPRSTPTGSPPKSPQRFRGSHRRARHAPGRADAKVDASSEMNSAYTGGHSRGYRSPTWRRMEIESE